MHFAPVPLERGRLDADENRRSPARGKTVTEILARHLSALRTIELLCCWSFGAGDSLSLAYSSIHLYYLLHRADQVTAQHACKSGIPRMLISGFEATYSPAHFPASCIRTYPSVDKSSVIRHDTYLWPESMRCNALHCETRSAVPRSSLRADCCRRCTAPRHRTVFSLPLSSRVSGEWDDMQPLSLPSTCR
jgi:hypothetical protein